MINNIQTEAIKSRPIKQEALLGTEKTQDKNNMSCFGDKMQCSDNLKNLENVNNIKEGLEEIDKKNKNKEIKTFMQTVIGAATVGVIGTLFYKNRQMAKKLSNVTSELAKTTEQLNSTKASLDKANNKISNISGIINQYANRSTTLNIGDITEKINSYNKLINALKELAKNVKP